MKPGRARPRVFAPGDVRRTCLVGSWKSARCLRAPRSLLKSSRFLFRDNAVYSLGTVHTGRSHLDMATSKQRRRNKFRGQSLEVHSGRRGVVLPQMPAVAPPGARRGHRGFGSQARVVRGPTSPQIQPLSCTRRTFQQAAGQRFLNAAVTWQARTALTPAVWMMLRRQLAQAEGTCGSIVLHGPASRSASQLRS